MPNPDLNVKYETHKISDTPLSPTNFFTNKRVGNFVSEYKDYKETQKKIQNLNNETGSSGFEYFHFVPSPMAINSINLGAIPSAKCLDVSDKSCLLIPYSSSYLSSSADGQYNTPDSHKLNLAKDYQTYLDATANSDLVPFQPKTTNTDENTIFISNDWMAFIQTGTPSNFDVYVDTFNTAPAPAPATAPSPASSSSSSYGVEIFAYMKFPKMGHYTFQFTQDSNDTVSQFLIWIGDIALCEYVADNATMTGIKPKYALNITDVQLVPIRIQYYATSSSTKKTQADVLSRLQVFSESGETTTTTTNFFYTTQTGNFLYPPLYLAFSSKLQNGYMAGKFVCHTNYGYISQITSNPTNAWTQLNKFYAIIRKEKRNIYKEKYVVDADNIKEVGQLNSLQIDDDTPTYYTQTTETSNLPNVFSLYRMSVDSRYDKTFQINTNARTEGIYDMSPIDKSLVTYSNSYTDFANTYPVNTHNISKKTKSECKEYCNNSKTCDYYYTYTHNDKPQCVVSSGNSTPPIFNQIRNELKMDQGSGTLSLRNRKFKDGLKKCTSTLSQTLEPDLLPNINNIDDYSVNFKYSNYDLSSVSISNGENIGMCGTPEYNKFLKQAQDILYTPHMYRDESGEWQHDDNSWSLHENMETQSTNAKSDTQTVIQANLKNHEILRQKMLGIDSHYRDLNRNIADYHRIHDYMHADNRYDQNGNILLYLKDKPPPSLTQINSNDSKVLTEQHTILFYTGIITAATLIVLAVTLGSE